MKKLIKTSFGLLIMCGIAGFISCNKVDDPTKTPPDRPTALEVSGVTVNSATFTWQGTATTYEIEIGSSIAQIVNAKSFSVSTLDADTPYTWRVRAKDGDLFSEWTDGKNFSTEVPPVVVPVPTNPARSDVTWNSATFTWEGTTTTYEIEIVSVIRQTVDAKSFTISTLEPSTSYTWRVRAKDGENYSNWVDGEEFTTEHEVIAAPTDPEVTNVTKTSALFEWQGTTTAYELLVTAVGDGTVAFEETVDSSTVPVYSLAPQTEYAWKVRAKKGDNVSEWTDGGNFTTLDAVSVPTSLEIMYIQVTSAAVRWTGGAQTYEISYGTASDGVEIKSDVIEDNVYYTMYDLKAGTEYSWKMRAKEGDIYSAWVDGPNFTTKPAALFKSAKLERLGGDEIHNYRLYLSGGSGDNTYTLCLDMYNTPGTDPSILPNGVYQVGGNGIKQIDGNKSYYSEPALGLNEAIVGGKVDIIKASSASAYTINVMSIETASGIILTHRFSNANVTNY